MTVPRHEFLGMTRHAVLHDTSSGTRLVPVAAFLAYVRQHDPTMTEPQLIKRMEAVDWTWERQTATHPDTGDSITVDFFRVPPSWDPS